MITITELHIYPVKSLQGISLEQATITSRGLNFDREWLVVDHKNRFVTQRELPSMATISTHLEDNHLTLRHQTMPPLRINLLQANKSNSQNVKIWKDWVPADDQGAEASRWLTTVLGKRQDHVLRLMRLAHGAQRQVDEQHLIYQSSTVAFADAYPFLITVEETLDALNCTLSEPVPMNRFRANIVIRGLKALQEHNIQQLDTMAGNISLRLRKPCQRCVVTITDQKSGMVSSTKEPLNTLINQNLFAPKRGGYFGQNAILLKGDRQTINVGDALTVTQ